MRLGSWYRKNMKSVILRKFRIHMLNDLVVNSFVDACLHLLKDFQFNLSLVWFASLFEAIVWIKISLMIHHADFYALFELLLRGNARFRSCFPLHTSFLRDLILHQFNFLHVCHSFTSWENEIFNTHLRSLSLFSLARILHYFKSIKNTAITITFTCIEIGFNDVDM